MDRVCAVLGFKYSWGTPNILNSFDLYIYHVYQKEIYKSLNFPPRFVQNFAWIIQKGLVFDYRASNKEMSKD